VNGPTPLLDFFKRGEVARDVRLLAAQGALAPRAHEQLAILVLLLEDTDPEIRRTADSTLNQIPVAVLRSFSRGPTCRSTSANSLPTAACFRMRSRRSKPLKTRINLLSSPKPSRRRRKPMRAS
jgi:hypothetical protein